MNLRRSHLVIGLLIVTWSVRSYADETDFVDGNALIRAPAGDSEIVIKTTSRLAGAIDSLTWKGREFIDSTDHGRQLQSASNFDAGSPVTNETFNPTEAGSRSDGAGPTSSSRLLHLIAKENRFESVNQMAFWLAPGERSDGNVAKNATPLSNHLLTKRVAIGWRDLPGVISYEVDFTLPTDEKHHIGTFEALTGYMPGEFAAFWKFDPKQRELVPLDDGPGEQSWPVVLSVREKTHAMGVYAPPQTAIGMTGPTYGRFRFVPEKVVKWNCVFRVDDQGPLAPGGHPFRVFVCVGDMETVRLQLTKLHEVFEE
jgi:hypothetical protein